MAARPRRERTLTLNGVTFKVHLHGWKREVRLLTIVEEHWMVDFKVHRGKSIFIVSSKGFSTYQEAFTYFSLFQRMVE